MIFNVNFSLLYYFYSEAAVAGFPYCETGLNFSTSTAAYSEDDNDYAPTGRRGKTSRVSYTLLPYPKIYIINTRNISINQEKKIQRRGRENHKGLKSMIFINTVFIYLFFAI